MKKPEQSKRRITSKLAFMMAAVVTISSVGITNSGVNRNAKSLFNKSVAHAEGEASADASGDGDNILDAKMGRVEFWEWNQLTKKNFADYMDDGEAHASMLFYYDTDTYRNKNTWSTMEPVGFISTYDDKDHIQRGYRDQNWTQYWDPYTTDKDRWDSFRNANFSYQCSNGNFLTGFAEEQSKMIKMDALGKSLNGTGYYKTKRFFTSGANGSFGVPYIKSRRSGTDIIGNLKSGGHWTQWCSEISLYLQRGSEKGKAGAGLNMGSRSTDTYVECWKGQEGKQPAIFLWKGTSGGSSSGGVHNQGKCFTMHPFSGDENSEFWVGRCMVGMDHDQIDYAKCDDNDHDDDYRTIPSLAVTKSGYMVAYDAKPLNGYGGGTVDVKNFSTQWSDHLVARNIFWNETPNVYGVFKWFVGTRHVFTCVNSLTIPKGKMKPYTAKDMLNTENDSDSTEGIIIPKGETLTIDGGTVTIECSVINNGKIEIKNGGSLIVKKGGCISSFTDKVDGSITCDDGSIVVMPGGKLLATDGDVSFTSSSTLVNYGATSIRKINMDGSCKLENRKDGIFFLGLKRKDNLTLMDGETITKSSVGNTEVVDGREENLFIDKRTGEKVKVDYRLTSTSNGKAAVTSQGQAIQIPCVLYTYTVKITSEVGVSVGEVTVELWFGPQSGGELVARELARNRFMQKYGLAEVMVGGVVCNYSTPPTVINEKTATFNSKGKGDSSLLNGVTITVPKY